MFKKSRLAQSLFAGALILTSIATFTTTSNPVYASGSDTAVTSLVANGQPSLAPMISRVLPSVVSINVKAVETVNQANPNDLFGQFLPKQLQNFLGQNFIPQTEQQVHRNVRYAGSGVIINAEKGYVVTNDHVVKNASLITVTLNDHRNYKAKVVGVDPDTDLAVLQLQDLNPKQPLTQISWGDSSKEQIGDFVVAIGNPFGIGLTATAGIVSALNRSTELNVYNNFIQTDAAINKGNSGGALVNLQGQLIGINSAILSGTGGSEGIGFAIPSNIVKSISDQLIQYGKVLRGQIGIRGTNLTPALQQIVKTTVSEGAFVSEVIPDSPAAKAGLEAGDIITKLNGTKIVDFNQLRAIVGSIPAKTKFEVTYVRNGEVKTTELTSAPRSEINKNQLANSANQQMINYKGVTFTESAKGVVIAKLDPNSQLAQYGVQVGDTLVSFQQENIKTLKDLSQAITNKGNSAILVLKLKHGDNRTLYITLVQSDN